MSALVPFPGSILELFTYAMSPFVYLSSIYLYIFSKILYSFYKEKEHEWAAAEWGLWLHWQEVHDCSVHPKFTLPNNWWFHWLFHQAPLQHLIKLLPCNILLSGMYLPKPLMIQVLVPPSITIALFFLVTFFISSSPSQTTGGFIGCFSKSHSSTWWSWLFAKFLIQSAFFYSPPRT